MNRVVLESPYAGNLSINLAYARAAVRDSLLRGEAPIASHLLYTQPNILNDNHRDERRLGIDAGHRWIKVADYLVVYIDLGISAGMCLGIEAAQALNKPIFYRTLNNFQSCPQPNKTNSLQKSAD